MIISDISRYVVEKERLSDDVQVDKWQLMPYETAEIKGKMLLAAECSFPDEITVELPVEGWHKIYLCMAQLGATNAVELSLLDEKGKGGRTYIMPTETRLAEDWWAWASYEFIEEAFYKCADLTGKKLRFNKPKSVGTPFTSAIAFIRLEKMTEEEIAEYKRGRENKVVMYHFDCDHYWDCDFQTTEDYIGRIDMLSDGNGEILLQETSFDNVPVQKSSIVPYLYSRRNNEMGNVRYLQRKNEVKELIGNRAHVLGMKYYACMRMEMGDFFFPYNEPAWNDCLVEKYPQFRCKTRDGREIMALSYAYPEVRKMAIDKIITTLSPAFDGVSLVFHRGVHVSHVQPVLDAVMEKYGVDARVLPYADERLHGVLCEFMTEFMREIKEALGKLGKKYDINVIVYDNLQDSKNFGFDVETWAKEGLITSVSQGLMRHYEYLDEVLDENGYIDLEKYKAYQAKLPALRRWYGDEQNVLVNGIQTLLPLKKYGIDVYGALAWEHADRNYQLQLVEKMQAVGVEKFMAWNANHIAKRLATVEAVKSIGAPKEEVNLYRKLHRVLSIYGRDISTFNPNWRG